MSKTSTNLQNAFAGESQANRKYLAWSKKAEQEGYKQAAKLFRAIAEAETIHAHNHLKQMGSIKTNKENLESAIAGEVFGSRNLNHRPDLNRRRPAEMGAVRPLFRRGAKRKTIPLTVMTTGTRNFAAAER